MNSIKKMVFHGFAWRGFVDISQQILQVIFTIILARLLTRADFGLVAMAILFTRFIRSMTQIGLGAAIIQSQEVTDGQISAIFLYQVILNFLLSFVCYASAPLAASFFKEPKLIPVVHVVAWIILINSFAFPQILLRKRLQFGGYSILEMSSMIFGNIIGIAMAFKGFGVWSLVFRLLTQRILFSIGIWPMAGWFPSKPIFAGTGKLFSFGLNMLGARISYYFSQNLAAIIVGKFIGVESLGSYNIAYNLAIVPAQKIRNVLVVVLFPALSKFQDDIVKFRQKFYASLFSLGIVFIPAMLGLAAIANNFVVVLYGEKWREAGLFLSFLAIVGMFKGMEHLLRSVIIARGKASVIFGITLAETVVSLPLLFLGTFYFHIIGLIAAYMVASIFGFFLTVKFTQHSVEDDTIFFHATIRSFVVAGLMFLMVKVYSLLISYTLLVTLCMQIVIGVVVYTLLRISILTNRERAIVSTWPLGHILLSNKRL